MRRQRRTRDLTGLQFHGWSVLSRTKSRKRGLSWWNCRCCCGKPAVVSGHDLTSGRRKSCGCLFRQHMSQLRRSRLNDLTGQRFGKLYVIGRQATIGQTKYECRCDCGKHTFVFANNLVHGHTKSCGCWDIERKKQTCGDKHWNWKGRRWVDIHGYVSVFQPNHPNAGRRGRIKEHILIMSQHLGRPLLPGETVHHKNGQRHDNRLENLELWASKHLPGQRVEDLVPFAKDLLLRYCTFDELADWLASQEEKSA